MNAPRILALLALAAAAPRAGAEGIEASLSAGYASFGHRGERGDVRDDGGVALGLRVEGRPAPHLGAGLSFTWGLTDWDRAREYVDAGNRAGRWTTDRFADVEAWATKKDAREDTRGLRLVAALFADMFLLLTYAAVPACYVGSVGGATSHLQLDATASFHLAASGQPDGWLEVGAGGAWLPYRVADWRSAYGPVIGLGMRAGPVRLGARMLWSPPGLNEAPYGGTIVAGALTLGFAR